MLVMYVAPFLLLVVLNIRIALTIHKARLHRHDIVANGYTTSNDLKDSPKTTSFSTLSKYGRHSGAGLDLNGSRRTR